MVEAQSTVAEHPLVTLSIVVLEEVSLDIVDKPLRLVKHPG
jgi:hypothetical protein